MTAAAQLPLGLAPDPLEVLRILRSTPAGDARIRAIRDAYGLPSRAAAVAVIRAAVAAPVARHDPAADRVRRLLGHADTLRWEPRRPPRDDDAIDRELAGVAEYRGFLDRWARGV